MQRENRNFNHNYSKLWSLIPPTPVFDVSMQLDPLMAFWLEAPLLRLAGSKMGETIDIDLCNSNSTHTVDIFASLVQGACSKWQTHK